MSMVKGNPAVIVEVYTRHSDEIRLVVRGSWFVVRVKKILNLIKGALCTIGNPFAARTLAKKIREFKQDVVHFHNQFPLISPLALWAAHQCGVKVVMTLHNYRTVCAAGIPMRDGHVCRECFRSRSDSRVELEKWRRAQAEKKVGEWLVGVDEAAFDAALERLVEEKSAAGEYRFKRPEEKDLALDGARRFFREFSRKIVSLSDGRCVYFAPDARAKARNPNNAVSWAEYAFHAVSNGGAKLSGKDYHERWYNPHKIPAFASIVTALNAEECFVRLSGVSVWQDAIVFAGPAGAGASIQVVTRLDDIGNMDANLSEVTFTATSKGQKKLPRLVPLTEAVRTVVHHQTTAGSYPPDNNMIAKPDDSCKGGLSVLPAIRHRCYRGSLLATLPLAINIWLYRKSWARWVDKFIVLSDFQKKIMISCGFPKEKVVVKPNFLPDDGSHETDQESRNGVLFIGRLTDEKGVRVLIRAWNEMGADAPTLRIAGDGDKRAEYESLSRNRRIEFLGQILAVDVRHELSKAKVLVVPSLWYEGLPTTILEAFRQSTPVIVSDLGPLPSTVPDGECGRVVRPGDVEDLISAIRSIGDDCWAEFGRNARKRFEALYTEQSHIESIRAVYAEDVHRR